ncbi:MAG: twin-arginine translocase subunit TatC [Actinomycetota bacterium]
MTAGHMTIWEHLSELRSRLFKSVLAIAIAAVIGWFLYSPVLQWLEAPYSEVQPDASLIATTPLQAFGLRMKLSVAIGIALAMPILLWQVWRFVTPGLYPKERKYAIPFILSSLVLFIFGAGVAYFVLNPTLEFLTNVGGSEIQPFYTADSYVTLIVFMMLAFGVGFEVPVLLVALQLIGVLTPKRLLQWWRPAVVIIAVVAAVITPSADPISLLALLIPMVLLYLLSIGIGWLLLKTRHRSQVEK